MKAANEHPANRTLGPSQTRPRVALTLAALAAAGLIALPILPAVAGGGTSPTVTQGSSSDPSLGEHAQHDDGSHAANHARRNHPRSHDDHRSKAHSDRSEHAGHGARTRGREHGSHGGGPAQVPNRRLPTGSVPLGTPADAADLAVGLGAALLMGLVAGIYLRLTT